MSYVLRLLGNERESLLQLANDLRSKVIDPRDVMNAVHEIDRAVGVLQSTSAKASAAGATPAAKKRGRKPRGGQLPRGESEASDTIPPAVGADGDEVNGDEEAVA
jgi:hypothetical protein